METYEEKIKRVSKAGITPPPRPRYWVESPDTPPPKRRKTYLPFPELPDLEASFPEAPQTPEMISLSDDSELGSEPDTIERLPASFHPDKDLAGKYAELPRELQDLINSYGVPTKKQCDFTIAKRKFENQQKILMDDKKDIRYVNILCHYESLKHAAVKRVAKKRRRLDLGLDGGVSLRTSRNPLRPHNIWNNKQYPWQPHDYYLRSYKRDFPVGYEDKTTEEIVDREKRLDALPLISYAVRGDEGENSRNVREFEELSEMSGPWQLPQRTRDVEPYCNYQEHTGYGFQYTPLTDGGYVNRGPSDLHLTVRSTW